MSGVVLVVAHPRHPNRESHPRVPFTPGGPRGSSWLIRPIAFSSCLGTRCPPADQPQTHLTWIPSSSHCLRRPEFGPRTRTASPCALNKINATPSPAAGGCWCCSGQRPQLRLRRAGAGQMAAKARSAQHQAIQTPVDTKHRPAPGPCRVPLGLSAPRPTAHAHCVQCAVCSCAHRLRTGVAFGFKLTSGNRGQVKRRVLHAHTHARTHVHTHARTHARAPLPPRAPPPHTHTRNPPPKHFSHCFLLRQPLFFSSVLSISGFARGSRCSNPVTWKPQLRRGAHHNWAGTPLYSPCFVFYIE
jgi:hypothetical protein